MNGLYTLNATQLREKLLAKEIESKDIVHSLLNRIKEVDPDIKAWEYINEEVIDMVRSRQVEIGIAFLPEGTGSLTFTPLFEDQFIAVVPPQSGLAQANTLSWATLLQQDFITLQRPSMVRRLLEQGLAKQRIDLPVAFESHQLSTVGRMVADGLGVSAVPSMCIQQMHQLGAHCVPLTSPGIACRVGILTHHELSVAAQALSKVLIEGINTPTLTPKHAR